jgi:hypothetical protein
VKREKPLLEGFVVTHWHAHPDGITDISVGSYDVTGCWHVWVSRDEHGNPLIHKRPYLVEEGRQREYESDHAFAASMQDFVLKLVREGKINVSKREQQHGKEKRASREGGSELDQPVHSAPGAREIRGTESGPRLAELRGASPGDATGSDA